jgi:hypothetical protein
MKKFWKFLIATLLLLIPVAIFAQDTEPSTGGFDVMSLFTSFTTYCAGIIVLTGVITKYILKNLSTLGRNIISWVVALIVGYLGWLLKLGMFVDKAWYDVLVIVLSFALGSNIIYDTEWIRKLLELLKLAPAKSVK